MRLFNAWSLTDFIRDRSHTAAPESVTRSHTLVYINDAPDAAGQAALNALYVLHFSRKTIKWRRLQVLSPQAMSLPLVSQVLNAGRRCAHQMCRYARLKTQQLTGEVVVKFNVSQSVTRLYHTPLLAANTRSKLSKCPRCAGCVNCRNSLNGLMNKTFRKFKTYNQSQFMHVHIRTKD